MASIDKTYARRIIAICDLIMVTSVMTSVCCWFPVHISLAGGISALNAVIVVGFRTWVARILKTVWTDSWLNLTLKRCVDLIAAFTLAIFVLPLCIILAFVVTKIVRCGSALTISLFRYSAEGSANARVVKGLVLRRTGTVMDTMLIRRMPMVANVLLWQISITDILTMSELAETQKQEPPENGGVDEEDKEKEDTAVYDS